METRQVGPVLAVALTLVTILLGGCITDDIDQIRDIFRGNRSSRAFLDWAPDLIPLEILVNPDRQQVGQATKFLVVVQNRGKKRSSETSMSISVGDARSTVQIPPLYPRSNVTLSIPDAFALPVGLSKILVEVDPRDNVAETDEANNRLATTVVVGEPFSTHKLCWSYGPRAWRIILRIPEDDYRGYQGGDRTISAYSDYLGYVTPEDRTVRALSEILYFYAAGAGYPRYDEVSFVLSMVQSLPYTSDEDTKGDDYPRYPVETLVEGGGDCEDTSILLASLLRNQNTFNYGCALIVIDDHMAVGIRGEEGVGGRYFEKSGLRYYYCETTGSGWRIGELPPQYEGAEIKALVEVP